MADDPLLALRGAERIGADPYVRGEVEQSPTGSAIDRWLAAKKAAVLAWLARHATVDPRMEPEGEIARGLMGAGGRYPGEMPYVPEREVGRGVAGMVPESMGEMYLSAMPELPGMGKLLNEEERVGSPWLRPRQPDVPPPYSRQLLDAEYLPTAKRRRAELGPSASTVAEARARGPQSAAAEWEAQFGPEWKQKYAQYQVGMGEGPIWSPSGEPIYHPPYLPGEAAATMTAPPRVRTPTELWEAGEPWVGGATKPPAPRPAESPPMNVKDVEGVLERQASRPLARAERDIELRNMEIRRAALSGRTAADVAKEFGIRPESVERLWAQNPKAATPGPGPGRRQISMKAADARASAAIRKVPWPQGVALAKGSGRTAAAVAKEFGVSEETVREVWASVRVAK